MPQYFFNLTNGETVRDEQGTRCDTVEDVKTYAPAVAAELGEMVSCVTGHWIRMGSMRGVAFLESCRSTSVSFDGA